MENIIIALVLIVLAVVFRVWIMIVVAGIISAFILGPLGGIIVGFIIYGVLKAMKEGDTPNEF